jgi:hypothetical protein
MEIVRQPSTTEKRSRVNSDSKIAIILKLGFSSVLLAYFLVWLPQRVAGLSFIGLEIGEWVKFLPGVRAGEYFASRTLFYIPPITLALMILAWTLGWSNHRWQTWATRLLAVIISLLAFPALESIRFEASDQWLPRIVLVILVIACSLLAGLATRLREQWITIISASVYLLLGLAGAILPAWTYLVLRPEISVLFGESVGVGPGIWLNAFGNLLVAGVGGYCLYTVTQSRAARTSST